MSFTVDGRNYSTQQRTQSRFRKFVEFKFRIGKKKITIFICDETRPFDDLIIHDELLQGTFFNIKYFFLVAVVFIDVDNIVCLVHLTTIDIFCLFSGRVRRLCVRSPCLCARVWQDAERFVWIEDIAFKSII